MTLSLVDKSALQQAQTSHQAETTLQELVVDNELAVCELVALEVLYSSRNPRDYDRRLADLRRFVWLAVDAVVLHYDKDFDLIAGVTGQPTRWILPRGSGHVPTANAHSSG